LSVSKVDSMLVICWDHLELHEKNVMEMWKGKEIWKQCIKHIGVPNQQVLVNSWQHTRVERCTWNHNSLGISYIILFPRCHLKHSSKDDDNQ
jgi:hypothetical protein